MMLQWFTCNQVLILEVIIVIEIRQVVVLVESCKVVFMINVGVIIGTKIVNRWVMVLMRV